MNAQLEANMLKFAKIESNSGKYPKQIYDDKEDQSYGFNPARKLQSGATRGVQQIKGKLEVVDETGTVRVIIGFQKDGF